jgi:hypothetical protein
MSEQLDVWQDYADLGPKGKNINVEEVEQFINALGFGRNNAQSASAIAFQLGNNDQGRQNRIRTIKQHALAEGYCVGSSRRDGYWLIANREELDAVKRELNNQITGLQRTINYLEENWNG